MSTTSINSGNALTNKQYSEALFTMAVRQPSPMNALSGPAPKVDTSDKVLRQQSTTDMPIVQVTDLESTAGDKVQIDCAQVVKLRAIMGDRNSEGMGASLKYAFQNIAIDMATLPISVGGKMTQKRFQHNLRRNAMGQLKGSIPRFLWQRALTQLAGARGVQDGNDWVLPLASDPDFVEMMVNPVVAPTYNRHYVVDGATLVQGGQQIALIDNSDRMLLTHLDQIAAIIDEMPIKMMPIQIPGDPAAGDDPIKGILMVDPLVWDSILTDPTAGYNIRTFQTNALERAKYGDLAKHPLFAGQPILWNGVLVRKMNFAVRFDCDGVGTANYISAANKYAGTETAATIPSIAGYQVARSLFLSAQALAKCSGVNTTSMTPYSLLENWTNFGRNLELAGEIIGAEQKLRFGFPDSTGANELTDFGVMAIYSIVKKRF